MILVDTSGWIDFFRRTVPLAERVDELLAQNQPSICGRILTELRRGSHSVAERRLPEERYLSEKFGESYKAYLAQVSRYL